MGKLSDVQIRLWIKQGEPFEQRGDSDGLTLRFRASDGVLRWLFRYRFAGKQRVILKTVVTRYLGHYFGEA